MLDRNYSMQMFPYFRCHNDRRVPRHPLHNIYRGVAIYSRNPTLTHHPRYEQLVYILYITHIVQLSQKAQATLYKQEKLVKKWDEYPGQIWEGLNGVPYHSLVRKQRHQERAREVRRWMENCTEALGDPKTIVPLVIMAVGREKIALETVSKI
jgi:hypothetical protein